MQALLTPGISMHPRVRLLFTEETDKLAPGPVLCTQWLHMQTAYNLAQARQHEDQIHVTRYVPNAPV